MTGRTGVKTRANFTTNYKRRAMRWEPPINMKMMSGDVGCSALSGDVGKIAWALT